MLISAVMIVKNIIFQVLHFVYDVYPCFSDKKKLKPPTSCKSLENFITQCYIKTNSQLQ